jgi:hypothetical protein
VSRKKVVQHIVVQGYPATGRLVRDAGGGQAGLFNYWDCWEFSPFWLNLGKLIHVNLMTPVLTPLYGYAY